MTPDNRHRRQRPHGFTLLELVVVIGIIALLASISFAVLGNMLASAKESATETTILKVSKLLQQQIGAAYRELDSNNPSTELKTAAGKYRKGNPATGFGDNYFLTGDVKTSYVLGIKDQYLNYFPQNAADAASIPLAVNRAVFAEWIDQHVDNPPTPNPDNPETHSSELLYLALTQGKIRGAPPVDLSSFLTSEVGDTDKDNYKEFVDAWGQPLRFYRSPTRLVNPWGFVSSTTNGAVPISGDIPLASGHGARFSGPLADVQAQNANATLFAIVGREVVEFDQVSGDSLSVVQRGAQSTDPQQHSSGTLVKLGPLTEVATLLLGAVNTSIMAHDPDDPLGLLVQGNLVNNSAIDGGSSDQDFERIFHTLDSYHTPLIVSAGADGEFGLLSPSALGTHGARDWGKLAQPDEGSDPDILINPGSGPLNDNITNHTAGAGN